MLTNQTKLYLVVPASDVPPREYFLKCLQTPEMIWGIRIGLVVIALIFIVSYFKMKKKKDKNGE